MPNSSVKVSPDALLNVAKDLFIQIYPSRMPAGSDPQILCEKAGYDRTKQAEYLAQEFAVFFSFLADSMQEKGRL